MEDWGKKLEKIYGEKKDAVIKKKNMERSDKGEAQGWIRDKLAPAFNKLKDKLMERGDVDVIIHFNTAQGNHLLKSTLKIKFREEYRLEYSIVLDASTGNITAETSFTVNSQRQTSKNIPSILKWGEDEIINDFLEVSESWEV